MLLLHSPGNTFGRDLAPGARLLVQPTALLYRDVSVGMHLHLEYPHSQGMSFGSLRSRSYEYRQIWLSLTGPGRVAVQSVFARPETHERITSSSFSSRRSW